MRCWRLGAVCVALAVLGALAPGASAVVVHSHGRFLGVAPQAGVPPAAIPGSVAAARAASGATTSGASSSSGNLNYNGGPVLHSSAPYAIYWAPSTETIPSSWQSLIARYFTDVAADSGRASNVYAVARQFTDAAGFADYQQTFNPAAQVVLDTNAYPASSCPVSLSTQTCLTDGQLRSEISALITAHGLPTDGPDAAAELPASAPIYFVVLPSDVNLCWSGGSGPCASNYFCAYHSYYVDGANDVLYAAIPSVALDSAQDAKGCQWDGNSPVQEPNGNLGDVALKYMSHEDNETITDPLGTAWWNDYSGNEDGDNCNDYDTDANAFLPTLGGDSSAGTLYDQLIAGDEYYLQSEWSNGGSSCLMRPSSATITPRFSVPTGPRSAGSTLSFDPTASTGTNRFTSETWNFGDGTPTSFHAGTPATATHTYAAPGDYTVTLALVDNRGNLSSATEEISVGASPTAALTASTTRLEEGSGAVSFDASGSSDVGASIVSYAWDFGDGTSTAQGATVSHTFASAGTYLVRLTVTDSLGRVDTATTTVTVTDEPPVAAFTIGTSSPQAGQPVWLDASSSSDADGSIVSYVWDFGDGYSGSGAIPSHIYGSAGTYTVTLTVTAAAGAIARSSQQVTVVDATTAATLGPSPAPPVPVTAAASPPVAAITVWARAVPPGRAVVFSGGRSYDANGRIVSYVWHFGDGSRASGRRATHRFARAGLYRVRLTVRDSLGHVASTTVRVRVGRVAGLRRSSGGGRGKR